MEELIKLKNNIEKIIAANYPDHAVDCMVSVSFDLSELNDYLENELSYAADAE